jgi:transposase
MKKDVFFYEKLLIKPPIATQDAEIITPNYFPLRPCATKKEFVMTTLNKNLNFNNQKFFIGLDVHKKTWQVTIRTLNMELKTFCMNPNPLELYKYMNKNYPGGTYYSVYETGFCGFWIHKKLVQLGFTNIVTNPPDIPTKQKEKVNKTDPIDSRKLARELESNSLESIYVPDDFHLQLRSLVRLRFRITQNLTRIKNRIKGFLHFYGIQIPNNLQSRWSNNFLIWLNSINLQYQQGNDSLNFMIEQFIFQRNQLLTITKKLKKYSQDPLISNNFRLISSIAGIGFISAITLYSEIIDINRFKNLSKNACFVGIIPFIRSSADEKSNLGITFRYNLYLKNLLIEASWFAIRLDPALTLKFKELSKRMPKNKAIIRIAKKLLNRIRFVWKNQVPYSTSVIE